MTRLSIPTLLLALTAVVLAPAPAHAEVLTIDDSWNHGEFTADISAVKVTHGPQNLFVRMKFFPRVGNVNVTEAWIDTRAGNPGPEFVLSRNDLYPHFVWVYRVNRWDFKGSHARDCEKATAGTDDGDVLLRVPRACLRIRGVAPNRVRVTAHAYDEEFVDQTEDWAPGKRHFGRRFVHSS